MPSSPLEYLSGMLPRELGRRFVLVGEGERWRALLRSLGLRLDEEGQLEGSDAKMGQRKSRGWESELSGRPSAVDEEAATAARRATTDFEGRVP
jgi:hypothetical protein